MNLIGKEKGTVLMEVNGPVIDSNVGEDPSVYVQVFGNGSVQVYSSSGWDFSGDPGGQNRVNVRPRPTGWNTVGDIISQTDGKTKVTLTPTAEFSALRLVLEEPGDGQAYWFTNL